MANGGILQGLKNGKDKAAALPARSNKNNGERRFHLFWLEIENENATGDFIYIENNKEKS